MAAYTNAKQRIPPLFQEIVKNHDAWDAILAKPVPTEFEWLQLKTLRQERRDFCREAEKALAWNTNKGEKV